MAIQDLTQQNIENLLKAFGSREIAWQEQLKKGRLAEKLTISCLEDRKCKIVRTALSLDGKGRDIQFIGADSIERIGEVKYLEGSKNGLAYSTLAFEVSTASGNISHSLREEDIDCYFFYNNHLKEIFLFEGKQFRKYVNKLKDIKTVRLPDDNGDGWCEGVRIAWEEHDAGYVTSWSTK